MSVPDGSMPRPLASLGVLSSRSGSAPGAGSVALADLLARSVPIAWYEAVAIVQEVCAAALRVGGGGAHIPELSGIGITGDGVVIVDSGPSQADAVGRAARMLSALLTDPALPVRLRFLLVQVTSPTTDYPSLAEFSKDLQFFERPGRGDLIREVYARWRTIESDPTAAARRVAREDRKEEPAPPEQKPEEVAAARRRGRGFVVAAAGAMGLIVAAALAVVAVWSGRSAAVEGEAVEAGLLEQTRAVATTGINWAADRLGLGAAAPAAPEGPEAADASRPEARARVSAGTSVRSGTALGENAGGPGPSVSASVRSALPPAGDVDERAAEDAALEAALIRANVVYSSADADVVPPMVIRPQMPPDEELDPRNADVAAMDIWVSDTGSVLFVRLRSGPPRMSHAMLLSAAKTWRFRPATKDGEPVAYRMTQRWVVRP